MLRNTARSHLCINYFSFICGRTITKKCITAYFFIIAIETSSQKLVLQASSGFQTPRNNKSTRPAASCFHLFLGVWNPWWNPRTRFWYMTKTTLCLRKRIGQRAEACRHISKIVRSDEREKILKLIASPLFPGCMQFSNNLASKRKVWSWTSPFYAWMAILENSKILMCESNTVQSAKLYTQIQAAFCWRFRLTMSTRI